MPSQAIYYRAERERERKIGNLVRESLILEIGCRCLDSWDEKIKCVRIWNSVCSFQLRTNFFFMHKDHSDKRRIHKPNKMKCNARRNWTIASCVQYAYAFLFRLWQHQSKSNTCENNNKKKRKRKQCPAVIICSLKIIWNCSFELSQYCVDACLSCCHSPSLRFISVLLCLCRCLPLMRLGIFLGTLKFYLTNMPIISTEIWMPCVRFTYRWFW